MNWTLCSASLFLLFMSSVCFGQIDFDGIEPFIANEMKNQHVPAVSVAVVQGDEIVYCQTFGKANLELDVDATKNTLFQLASVTKPITAVALMTLVEDEKLDLDDRIGNYVEKIPEAWQPITIRHLLSHTSGIKSFTDTQLEGRKDHTPEQVLDYVRDAPLVFQPGHGWGYSNTNFFLLGMIVNKASGKPYKEYVQQRVLGPAEMKSTRLNDLHAVIPHRAQGYSWTGSEQRIGDYHSPTLPFAAGGLITTAEDMAKFDLALKKGTLISKDTFEKMCEPTSYMSGGEERKAEYGLGWQMTQQDGVRMVGHGGGIPGFSSFYMRLPTKDTSIIVLANQESCNPLGFIQGIVRILKLID